MTFSVRVSVVVAAVLVARPALAVRPFITDDARVVGERAAQMETWLRADKVGLQHWIVGAIGPVAPLEVSVGMVYGRQSEAFTLAAPLFQAKALVLETMPGRGGRGWP
ncbi:MAG: hypothetical protein EOO74_03215, partial [Myxococcales bacterium]